MQSADRLKDIEAGKKSSCVFCVLRSTSQHQGCFDGDSGEIYETRRIQMGIPKRDDAILKWNCHWNHPVQPTDLDTIKTLSVPGHVRENRDTVHLWQWWSSWQRRCQLSTARGEEDRVWRGNSLLHHLQDQEHGRHQHHMAWPGVCHRLVPNSCHSSWWRCVSRVVVVLVDVFCCWWWWCGSSSGGGEGNSSSSGLVLNVVVVMVQ